MNRGSLKTIAMLFYDLMGVGETMRQSILITGCSTGIGQDAALTLQTRGYLVVATYRKEEDHAKLKALGLKHLVQLDLNHSESINNAVKQTLDITGGTLFALFNNAAYGLPGAVEDLTREALRRQFETNVLGTHELTCALLPTLLAMPDARIVQNSSVLGLVTMPARGAYVASKFALEGLTDTLRLELEDTPVKVSLIEPGPILSNFRANALAALEKEVDYKNSRHKAMYERSLARLHTQGAAMPFTLPASAVTQKLIHALEAKKPKCRYYVTVPTYLMGTLRRLLSSRLLDKFILKYGRP